MIMTIIRQAGASCVLALSALVKASNQRRSNEPGRPRQGERDHRAINTHTFLCDAFVTTITIHRRSTLRPSLLRPPSRLATPRPVASCLFFFFLLFH